MERTLEQLVEMLERARRRRCERSTCCRRTSGSWCCRSGTRRRRRIRASSASTSCSRSRSRSGRTPWRWCTKAQQLTYRELNAQANRLAHRLIELGVRPGRAGGAVRGAAPANGRGAAGDPQGGRCVRAAGSELPDGAAAGAGARRGAGAGAERRSGPRGAGDRGQRRGCGAGARRAVGVWRGRDEPGGGGADVEESGVRHLHVGVDGETQGRDGRASRRWCDLLERDAALVSASTKQDVWCSSHSFAFDVSVWELWGALRYGARLVLVPRRTSARSPSVSSSWCASSGVHGR